MSSGTHGAFQAISKAGIPTEAATAIAQAIGELRTSTQADIARLHADIVDLRSWTKAGFAELRAETKANTADLRADLREEIATLRTELKTEIKSDIAALRSALEWRMYMMFCGTVVTIVASLAGLARFLH